MAIQAPKVLGTQRFSIILTDIIAYRSLQILIELFNVSMRSMLFLLLLACGTNQLASACGLIRNGSSIHFIMSLLFEIMIFETVIVIAVVYGLAGQFYDNSVKSIVKLEQMARYSHVKDKTNRKYILKFLMSCHFGLRIKFGLSNFIEKTTPLIFQKFCVDRIIDILLVR